MLTTAGPPAFRHITRLHWFYHRRLIMIHPRLRLLAYLSLGLQIGLTVEQQIPLVVEDAHYEFQWPIHKIAVIGAGVG